VSPPSSLLIQPKAKRRKRKAGIRGLSEHDQTILKKVKRWAWNLDRCFECCCGCSAGWSAVIGILPVVGDIIDVFFALYLVKICMRVDDLPKWTVNGHEKRIDSGV